MTKKLFPPLKRRHFIAASGATALSAGITGFPSILRAQEPEVARSAGPG